MNRSVLSITVIIATMISVGLMLDTNGDLRKKYVSDIKNYEKALQQDKNKPEITGSVVKTAKISKNENKIDKFANDKEDSSSNRKMERGFQEQKNSVIVDKTNAEIDKELYKGIKEAVEKNISTVDRNTLQQISAKISPSDYARINNYIGKDDDGDGIIKALVLLKLRLGNKDYEKLKVTLGKYTDIAKLEKIMSN